jgi:hypothetical protein
MSIPFEEKDITKQKWHSAEPRRYWSSFVEFQITYLMNDEIQGCFLPRQREDNFITVNNNFDKVLKYIISVNFNRAHDFLYYCLNTILDYSYWHSDWTESPDRSVRSIPTVHRWNERHTISGDLSYTAKRPCLLKFVLVIDRCFDNIAFDRLEIREKLLWKGCGFWNDRWVILWCKLLTFWELEKILKHEVEGRLWLDENFRSPQKTHRRSNAPTLITCLDWS